MSKLLKKDIRALIANGINIGVTIECLNGNRTFTLTDFDQLRISNHGTIYCEVEGEKPIIIFLLEYNQYATPIK